MAGVDKSSDKYPGLTEAQVAKLRDDGFTLEQIKKLSDRELSELNSYLDSLTLVNGPRQQHSEIRVVLLGKTGAGKSSTGNTILGKKAFEESAKSVSCTELIKEDSVVVNGILVRMIDTPGIFDTSKGKEHTLTEIAKILDSFSEGIHAFLFVFNMGNPRFTEEERAAFDLMEKSFKGPSFMDHCFIILSGATKDLSLSKRLHNERETPFGQLIMDSLKRKVIAVDNKNPNPYFKEELQKRIVELVANSVDVPYTNKVFEIYSSHKEETAAQLPEEVQHLVPQIERVVSKKLQKLSHNDMKDLSADQTQKIADDIFKKLRKTNEADTRRVSEEVIQQAIPIIEKAQRERIGDEIFLEKAAEFGGKLLSTAGNLVLPGLSTIKGWFGY